MPNLNVRRIVTGHDESGRSIVKTDSVLPGKVLGDAAEMVLAWTTDTFPSDNNDDFDGAQREVHRVSPGGTVLQFVDMYPHTSSKHHRTRSLDYGIVLDGEIDLELDNGVKTRCKKGDVVIQRGTIHTWSNPTDEVSRMVFVLLDAEPVAVGDSVLEPEN